MTSQSANSDRESLIDRCRKLRNITTERGASEAEANFAAKRLAEMMAEHAIQQDELSLRRDAQGCVTDEFADISGLHSDWTYTVSAIARLFGTRAWLHSSFEDILGIGEPMKVTYVKFFGLEADVNASICLAAICYTAITTEAEKPANTRGLGRGAKASFILGMAQRLAARIKELQPIIAESTGRGLIVLKDQLVTEEFAKLNLRLRRGGSATRKVNTAAYEKGKARAESVDIGARSRFGKAQAGQRRLV